MLPVVAVDRTQLHDMTTSSTHQASPLINNTSPCAYDVSGRMTTSHAAISSPLHSSHNTAVTNISDHVDSHVNGTDVISSNHVSLSDAISNRVNSTPGGVSRDRAGSSSDVISNRMSSSDDGSGGDACNVDVKAPSPQLSPRRRIGHAYPPPVPAHILEAAQVIATPFWLLVPAKIMQSSSPVGHVCSQTCTCAMYTDLGHEPRSVSNLSPRV